MFHPKILVFTIVISIIIGVFAISIPGAISLYYYLAGIKYLNLGSPEIKYYYCYPFNDRNRVIANEIDEGIKLLTKSISYQPNRSSAYLQLARSYCLINQYPYAKSNLEKYISSKPNDPIGKIEYAFVDMENNRSLKEATYMLQKAKISLGDILQVHNQLLKQANSMEANYWLDIATNYSGDSPNVINTDFGKSVLILDGFISTQNWIPCSWCNNTSKSEFVVNNGVLNMSFTNDKEKRDALSYRYTTPIPIKNFSHLLLRYKADYSTLLTLELVIDGNRTRVLNYVPVATEWDTLEIPIEGNMLDEIFIGIGEYANSAILDNYHLQIDWIGVTK